MFTVLITPSALWFAIAIATAIAFWLAWHQAHKYVALTCAALSVVALSYAIGGSSTIQLFLGSVIVLIPYVCYRWFLDYRHDAAQAAKGKTSTHKDAK